MIVSVARSSRCQSGGGTPRTQAITSSGSGAANVVTKSHATASPPVEASSTTWVAMRPTSPNRARTAFRVNSRLAIWRMGPCRGGSRNTIISSPAIASDTASALRSRVIPLALEKSSGWEATWTRSACLVMAQNGGNPGGSKYATGASARNRAHTWCG